MATAEVASNWAFICGRNNLQSSVFSLLIETLILSTEYNNENFL